MNDPNPAPRNLGSLILVVAGYLCLMATSYFLFIRDLFSTDLFIDRDMLVKFYVSQELADAALLAVMLVLIPRPPRHPASGAWSAWLAALPLLGILLGVNFGYHTGMRAIVEALGVEVPKLDDITLDYGIWAITLICVQPAVVEELFFRHLFLGHLRPHVGVHGAVWVSAAAFALVHVGRGLSWPLLALLGAFLGYARVRSATLILPMILHFLHNLAVLWIERRYGG